MAEGLIVRRAVREDLPELTALYNHYIETSACTFDLKPYTVEQRTPWFEQFRETGRYQLFVALAGGKLVGYAGSMQYRAKAAYDPSVESTVYVRNGAGRHGTGTRLYETLFAALAKEDVHRVYAGITMPNPASIALHKRFGFTLAGAYNQVGRKFDRYWDVEWYEKRMR